MVKEEHDKLTGMNHVAPSFSPNLIPTMKPTSSFEPHHHTKHGDYNTG
jgi:hypothetical protein